MKIKSMECPIYCMYAVYENQCIDNDMKNAPKSLVNPRFRGGYKVFWGIIQKVKETVQLLRA